MTGHAPGNAPAKAAGHKSGERGDNLARTYPKGTRFGHLVVVEYIGKSRYKMLCDCGNTIEVYSSNLCSGQKTSCGCADKVYRKDYTGKVFGKLTVIEYDKKRKRWKCQCECGNITYAIGRNLKIGNTTSCGCAYIDKAQREIVENTRITQIGKYSASSGKVRKSNTSGVTGVWWNQRRSKWFASIDFQKKTYYLGCYDKKEDAAEIRRLAEERLHGEFLDWYYSQFPDKKPGN